MVPKAQITFTNRPWSQDKAKGIREPAPVTCYSPKLCA